MYFYKNKSILPTYFSMLFTRVRVSYLINIYCLALVILIVNEVIYKFYVYQCHI